MSIRLKSLLVAGVFLALPTAHAWEAPALPAPDAARLAGPWAAAQVRNAQRLAAPPLDQPDFILDDVALKQHRKFAEYSGDISGRWIGAAAFLAPQFPNAFTSLPPVMAGIAQCQNADGHFGAEQQLPTLERKRDMPILWGNGRLLAGLVEVYDQRGDPAALAMARKLGNYLVATDSIYDRAENLRTVGGSYSDGFGTCYFSCIEGLVALGRATGDQRYVEEATRIAQLALSVTNFDGLHSHGRLCAIRGFAELCAQTGQSRWCQAAERDWQIFSCRHLLPTGGVKETLEAKCNRDEGCAEADWLRLNLLLWRLTGEGCYLDTAERALKNHFMYQQFANGGAGHRLLHQIAGQPVAFKALSEEAWWCCGEHWARAMVEVARNAVVAAPRGPIIALALDCDTSLSGPGGLWQAVLRETPDGFTARLTPSKPVKAEVCIHRPAWAANGKVQAPKGITVRARGDAWVLTGTWRGDSTVRVRLPGTVRVEGTAEDAGVLVRGHDLLVAAPTPINAWLTGQLPAVRPVVQWSPSLALANGRVVVLASLEANPDPLDPAQWRPLELTPLRAEAASPDHRLAWFSFRPRFVVPPLSKAR